MNLRSPRLRAALGALLAAVTTACSEHGTSSTEPAARQAASAPTPEQRLATDVSIPNTGVKLRLFTPRDGAVYEVIEGAGGGGAFIRRDRGECAVYLWYGESCPSNRRIIGYTDRVARGETIHVSALGWDWADEVGLSSNGRTIYSWGARWLPAYVGTTVSTNPNHDNIHAFARVLGQTYSKRVPVGTR